jgi:hypothetical protein
MSKPKHKRPPEPEITQELVDRFLAAYGWMARSRHARERTLYRIAEWQREQLSRLMLQQGIAGHERKWTDTVERRGK